MVSVTIGGRAALRKGLHRGGHGVSRERRALVFVPGTTGMKKGAPEGMRPRHNDVPKERERYERATLPDLRQLVHTFIFLR